MNLTAHYLECGLTYIVWNSLSSGLVALDSKIIYFLFPTYGQWVVALKISHLCFTGDVVGNNMLQV